jgi:hypothetical protein
MSTIAAVRAALQAAADPADAKREACSIATSFGSTERRRARVPTIDPDEELPRARGASWGAMGPVGLEPTTKRL